MDIFNHMGLSLVHYVNKKHCTIDHWQCIWNAQMSISTPVCINPILVHREYLYIYLWNNMNCICNDDIHTSITHQCGCFKSLLQSLRLSQVQSYKSQVLSHSIHLKVPGCPTFWVKVPGSPTCYHKSPRSSCISPRFSQVHPKSPRSPSFKSQVVPAFSIKSQVSQLIPGQGPCPRLSQVLGLLTWDLPGMSLEIPGTPPWPGTNFGRGGYLHSPTQLCWRYHSLPLSQHLQTFLFINPQFRIW